jgi:hypothetical protein
VQILLGPTSVSRLGQPRARAVLSLSSATLLVEGMRAVLFFQPASSTVLQSQLPSGGTMLAAVAGQPPVSADTARPGAAAGTVPPLSGPGAAATSGRGGANSGVARGPAPCRDSGRFVRSTVRPAGLLRAVCVTGLCSAATFLFVLLSSGFTERARSRDAVAPAAASRPKPIGSWAWLAASARATTSLLIAGHSLEF